MSGGGFIPAAALVAGIDEAGRGPLAGPVYAAAVILHPRRMPFGLDDSKRLTPAAREALVPEIEAAAQAHAVAWASPAEIDALNILQATLLAMRRAVLALKLTPTLAIVDGNRCPPGLPCAARAIVGGDGTEPAICAASVLAKVARDREMCRLDQAHPQYGFAQHKGYGTAEHLAALRAHGPCAIHRRSFAPVRALLGLAADGAPSHVGLPR
jgi:ribonuclease HII